MRYDTGELLGQGAMGEVYRAFDPSLQREVALKFLRREEPRQIERLLREARAQAKVDHDLVCKVYEVGELDGRHYIAMQLIEGVPLDVAARTMTVEERVVAVRDVAGAVHAAHRIGLVHRDLKPGNILVESRGGSRKPFVTDFGLVRDDSAESLTKTGEALGTPPYMAPEQARGELHRLDRRTDVYSLGAMLYEMLAGRTPFLGKSAVEVLFQVVHAEAPLLRKLDAAIPRDLEIIAARCLEKEPQHRYQSAKDLEDDLSRWLDGEPIAARPAGLLRRAWTRARKNKLAAASMAAGVLAAVVLLAALWRAQSGAARKARLAQQLGQSVERIESGMRLAYLLPLHDLRPERERARAQLSEIETQVERFGAAAEGPVSGALGRGLLVLGQLDAARTRLARAIALGERDAQIDFALGRTLGSIYERELDSLRRQPKGPERDQRQRQVEEELRKPALESLRGSLAAAGAAPFVEGLLALHEGRLDDALRLAARAAAEDAGLYEAHVLAGRAHEKRSRELSARSDFAASGAESDAAVAAYDGALLIARSEPWVLWQVCRCWADRLVHADRTTIAGGEPELFQRGAEACGRALVARPVDSGLLYLSAQLHWHHADYLHKHGGDALPVLDRVAELASAAIAADDASAPGSSARRAGANRTVGLAHKTRATILQSLGKDATADLESAIASMRRAVDLWPDNNIANMSLGNVWSEYAKALAGAGRDPFDAFDKATASLERAVALVPEGLGYLNLGTNLQRRAREELRSGQDPRATIGKAQAALASCTRLMPNYAEPWSVLGELLADRSAWEERAGQPPEPNEQLAEQAFRKAIALEPAEPEVRDQLGRLLQNRAARLRARALPAAAEVAEARAAFRESMRLNGNALEPMAHLALLEAEAGDATLPEAHRLIEVARRRAPLDARWHVAAGQIHRLEAERRKGARAEAAIDGGLAAVARALAIAPGSVEAHVERGRLLLARARLRSGGSKGSAKEAAGSLRAALRLNPALRPQLSGALAEADRLSAGGREGVRSQ